MAPFAVVFWSAIAFAAGALFDVRGRTQKSNPSLMASRHNDTINESTAKVKMDDTWERAGQEGLSGEVLRDLWTRSLGMADRGELAVMAEYDRLRQEHLAKTTHFAEFINKTVDGSEKKLGLMNVLSEQSNNSFDFSEYELSVYGFHQVDVLEEALKIDDEDQMFAIRNAIGRKIGRIFGTGDERVFLTAYCQQLRSHLENVSDPPLSKGSDGQRGGRDNYADGWAKWTWCAGGLCLLFAYCIYASGNQKSELAIASADMSYPQASAYRNCMGANRGYNLSDSTQSDICRKSALSYNGGSDCHTEWDGRANPAICE